MNKGKFESGNKFTFKKGVTNKKPKLFWNKEWLQKEFLVKSVEQISKDLDVSKRILYFWLDKHNIMKKKPTGFIVKYWLNGKRLSTTLEQDGKRVNSGYFGR